MSLGQNVCIRNMGNMALALDPGFRLSSCDLWRIMRSEVKVYGLRARFWGSSTHDGYSSTWGREG